MPNKLYNRPSLTGIRRQLRKNATPEEERLWSRLKGKRLCNRKFRRQHSIDIWVVDFYCPAERLVIEVDGAHHFSKQGNYTDSLRDCSFKEELDITVLRFENHRVRDDIEGVLNEIKSHFGSNEPSTS